MPSKIATAGVDKAHAATYFRKSRQLCEAAGAELDADRSDASLILAIHAGISAADAVCIGLGTRKNKESHERPPICSSKWAVTQMSSSRPRTVSAP